MSKSLGNGIDPIDMIESYGADAVRLLPPAPHARGPGRASLSEDRFEMGRRFTNKVWNATRFVLENLGDGSREPSTPGLARSPATLEDRWILSRLVEHTRDTVTAALDGVRLQRRGVTTLYRFVWNDLCDWYLELVKSRLDRRRRSASDGGAAAARATLVHVLGATFLRLLHPLTPFQTEVLWKPRCDEARGGTDEPGLLDARRPGRSEDVAPRRPGGRGGDRRPAGARPRRAQHPRADEPRVTGSRCRALVVAPGERELGSPARVPRARPAR